jgi:hypothetical protein
MKRSLKSLMVYALEYLHNGLTLTAHLIPVDAGNGVIMDDAGDGFMMGRLTTGGNIRVSLENIVNLSVLDVFWRNNQGTHNHSKWDDDVIADHLDRCPRDDDGVVQTPLHRIDSGDGEVYNSRRRDEPEPEPEAKQTSLFGGLFG